MSARGLIKGIAVLAMTAVMLSVGADKAFADEGITGAFDEITELVVDIATAVVRLILIVSGALFTLGVVRGAFDGVLGSALGNTFTASAGIYRAIGAIVAFVVLLFGVGFSRNFVEFLAEKFLLEENMSLPVVEAPEGVVGTPPVSMEEALQLDPVQEVLSDFVLALIRVMIGAGVALFTVAVATGAFDAQLGNIIGNSLAVSRGYSRIIGAAAAVLFLILSMPLAKALVDALVPNLLAGGVQIPDVLP
ncbi:MAG: hypothetical protein ACC700_17020 [Anaerolineales bacterium]